jgi:transglutaminase-like putative cysteine protease
MFWDFEFKEGWVTVILLMAVNLCVAWSIQSARWTQGLSILQGAVLVGCLLGIVLAKSRVPRTTAHLLSLLSGFTWAAYLTSNVIGERLQLLQPQAVAEFERRLGQFLTVLFSGGDFAGNYVFLFLLAFLLWLVGYFGAWAIFRWRRTWWTVIVCGVALMLNIDAAPYNLTGYMIAFVLFALLLVVRTNLAFYEEEWRVSRVGYSSEMVYGFLRAGLVVSVLTVLLAWAAPIALASRPVQDIWDQVSEPWRKLQNESSRIFQDLNYPAQPAFVTFARSMRFGGAVDLPDTPVMDVDGSFGRYWRVIAFHEYTGDGWDNTDAGTALIEAGEQKLAVPEFDLRREVTHTITLRQNLGQSGVIAAAAQPLWSDLPLRVVVGVIAPGEGRARSADAASAPQSPADPSVLYSRRPLEAGQSYQVRSSLTRADAESLRGAGTEYPKAIAERYLQLPDSLPDRVRVLADQVAIGRDNPYDKAVAVEHYLRDIPYNEQILGPEPDQDGVDYFLFDAREGYCDYYSSAMVVMLRSVGVPARYVRGYSQGLREEGLYRILERDGHAWPEVYFPGYGWVEFEPTAGEPVLVRAANRERNPPPGPMGRDRPLMDDEFPQEPRDYDPGAAGPVPTSTTELLWQQLGRGGGLLLTAVAFVLVFAALLMVRRQRRIEGLSIAERVYLDLAYWSRRLLAMDPLAHQTPLEYAGEVARVVPSRREAIEQIADIYVQERFGAKSISGEAAEAAWDLVMPELWRRWLQSQAERLQSLRSRLVRRLKRRRVWQEVGS